MWQTPQRSLQHSKTELMCSLISSHVIVWHCQMVPSPPLQKQGLVIWVLAGQLLRHRTLFPHRLRPTLALKVLLCKPNKPSQVPSNRVMLSGLILFLTSVPLQCIASSKKCNLSRANRDLRDSLHVGVGGGGHSASPSQSAAAQIRDVTSEVEQSGDRQV
jgi:hypothetical protein